MHTEIREFTRRLVRMLVDQPEAVKVAAEPADDGFIHLAIRVAPGEIGMVIGRQGRSIEAIRHLVVACATKSGLRVKLKVEEPGGSQVGH